MRLSPEPSMMECKTPDTGYIHSTESFGTVDGPGIRMVVFFQGCPMRCLYCHNPDTWQAKKGTPMTVEELLSMYEKNRNFYRNGGITATGGEPLMQLAFLTSFFEQAQARGIHTCLDTSGITFRKGREEEFRRLLKATSLILLDLKHSSPAGHKALTGQEQGHVLDFLAFTEACQTPVIIRHVIVKGYTDGRDELEGIGRILAKHKNIRGLEVLPYHNMGEQKYRELGMDYPLKGMENLEKEAAGQARKIILESLKKYRNILA